MTTEEEIKTMLDDLSELEYEFETDRLDFQAARDEILKAVKDQLDSLDAEYNPLFASSRQTMDGLIEKIKSAALEHGSTVKGKAMQAVYSKGRTSWDNKALDGYGVAHPEILVFRKTGEASVSIRKN